MKSIRRTTILALSMFIILALLSFGSAFAYFSDKANAGGSVTLGHLEIELKQGSDTVTALATVNNLEPGGYLVGTESNYHSYTIDTTKANIACYLRVKISSELEDVPSNDIFNTDLGTGWYLHNDGYYYQVTDNPATSSSTIYKVPASQNSVQLNVKIQLKPSVEGKEYMNKSGSYKIIVQALQADYLESISVDNIYTVTELSNIWSQSLTTEEIFIIEDGVLTGLTDYGKTLSRLTVPSGVTAIGDRAFQNNTNIVSVTLPDGLETIGYRSFLLNENLQAINFPDSLTSIGSSAFAGCYSLESVNIPEGITIVEQTTFSDCYKLKSLSIPSTVKVINNGAFQACYILEEIVLPEGLEEIRDYAFNNCHEIIIADIPSSVKKIGYRAFSYCDKLTSIAIPVSVTSIGESAFAGCYNITDIIVEEGNPNYYSLKNGINYHALVSNDGMLIQGCNLSIIPSDVKVIGYGAFEGFTELTNITLPDTLIKIGDFAFNYCRNLEVDLVIPDSVTTIGNAAFQGCEKLNSLTLNEGLLCVGNFAFNYCGNLEVDLIIPSSVTTIGECAFQGCSKIKSLTLNEGLLWIGDWAFNNCSGITNTTIIIPSTVVQIGGESYIGDNESNNIIGTAIFKNADKYVTKFEVAEGNAHFKTDEYGALYTINNKYLIAYSNANTTTEYSILEGCERLFEYSLSGAYNLKSLNIPDSLLLEYTDSINIPTNFNVVRANPLQGGIYIYTAINDFVVNDTNPKYKSVDGIIYSKDGTRVIAVPVQNWTKEGANKVLSFDDSVTSIENIFYHWERDIDLDKIIIGANIASIHEYFISNLNEMVDNYGLIIEIDSNNEYYELVNGKIVAKNTSIQVSGAPNGSENNKSQPSDGQCADYQIKFQ